MKSKFLSGKKINVFTLGVFLGTITGALVVALISVI
ncbi:hypothetical protein MAELSTROM_30 [Pseudoalteromonas phage Maelstrom]|nr:hypothetical protein PP584_gp30 [Pseudoalteromonas phage Maelstrom]AUG84950.1 hypothetical protein MAELSTROM_30 [Pseudoalteromonas phage Maelstrom]